MAYLQKTRRFSVTANYTILVDDRERNPWDFGRLKYPVQVKTQRLFVGDYTINGLSDKIAVEKKNSLSELCVNLSIQDRARFIKTLERLSRYQVKYLVIEDSIANVGITIKKLPAKSRLTEESLFYWLTKIQCFYKIPIIWLSNNSRIQKKILTCLWEHILEVDVSRKD